MFRLYNGGTFSARAPRGYTEKLGWEGDCRSYTDDGIGLGALSEALVAASSTVSGGSAAEAIRRTAGTEKGTSACEVTLPSACAVSGRLLSGCGCGRCCGGLGSRSSSGTRACTESSIAAS